METRDIHTLEELDGIVGEIRGRLMLKDGAHVLALSGDLGAGKTAFVKVLAKQLGIVDEVTSPTFVIMKSYPIPNHSIFKTLTHIDAYRVETEDEMRVLGFTELLADPSRLIAIEWPERIADLIPEDVHKISIELTGEVRTVTF